MIEIAKHGDLKDIDFVMKHFPLPIELKNISAKNNGDVDSYQIVKSRYRTKHMYLNYYVTSKQSLFSNLEEDPTLSIININELVCIHVEDLRKRLGIVGNIWMQADYSGLRAILHKTSSAETWLSLLGGQDGNCAKIIAITQTRLTGQ